jgi:hypothetical protein
VKTPGGQVIAFMEDANVTGPNFVRQVSLNPGSYIFSAARESADTEGAVETVTFEVK